MGICQGWTWAELWLGMALGRRLVNGYVLDMRLAQAGLRMGWAWAVPKLRLGLAVAWHRLGALVLGCAKVLHWPCFG